MGVLPVLVLKGVRGGQAGTEVGGPGSGEAPQIPTALQTSRLSLPCAHTGPWGYNGSRVLGPQASLCPPRTWAFLHALALWLGPGQRLQGGGSGHPGHNTALSPSAGPDFRGAVRGVRGRRGSAAVHTLRRRLPLAMPFPGGRTVVRVSACGGAAGSTPAGRTPNPVLCPSAARRSGPRCRSCTPAPPAHAEGAPAPSSACPTTVPAKVSGGGWRGPAGGTRGAVGGGSGRSPEAALLWGEIS